MATLFKRRKNGGGYVYYVTGYVNGKHFMRSTKASDKKVAMEVLKKVEEENIRIEEGLEPVDKIDPILLSEFIEIYLTEREKDGKAPRTIETDKYALYRLLDFTGDCSMNTINEEVAFRYRRYKDQTVKPASASIELRSIRAAFNWAVEKPGSKLLRQNPFAKRGIIPTVENENIPLCLSPSEKEQFLRAVDDEEHLKLFKFFILTGCRRGEAVNLQWVDIDLEEKKITFRKTKTKKDRSIPISLELMQVIMSLNRTKPKPFNYISGSVSRIFRIYRRKAGLRNELHLHCLRHTTASDLVRNGLHLKQIAEYLGHTNTNTTQIYTHVVLDDLRNVAEALTCVG